jgi:uncharacterized membrane protein YphA (DoxX/SURF4 family)
MLNTFPTLLSFGLFAPLLLRLTVGFILIYLGHQIVTKKRSIVRSYFENKKYPMSHTLPWMLGLAKILVGVFLIIGFSTQIISTIAIYLLLNMAWIEKNGNNFFRYSPLLYKILAIISLTLLITGAGLFAVDLPL